jgi:hypothetical protein
MGLMNDYARVGMEFFELMMKVFEFFQYVLLRLFNNNVLLIKQIDTNNAVSYAIPPLGMVFRQGCLPRFYSENEVLPLMFVYHVKNCEMHSMICKDRCILDVNLYITFLDEMIGFKNRDKISKKYMFVELGCENITATFKKIAWCFLEVEFTVSDLKRLLSHKSRDKDTLILTDSDMNMTEFENDEDVIKLL